jgi:BarA-like signal transduction histidine kinase
MQEERKLLFIERNSPMLHATIDKLLKSPSRIRQIRSVCSTCVAYADVRTIDMPLKSPSRIRQIHEQLA